ncbi:hypothetical protein BH10PSE1_BH10PSE1_13470 [soil metagenome]
MTDPTPNPDASSPGGGGPVPASAAKQARKGSRTLVILIAALGLTALGFAAVWVAWKNPFNAANANDGKQTVDAAAFQNGDRSIPQADAPTTATGEPTRPPTGETPNVNAPVASTPPSPR